LNKKINLIKTKFAVVTPMANESAMFHLFTKSLQSQLNNIKMGGMVYFVVDNKSKDDTLNLCQKFSKKDHRFKTIYSPNNRNVVDAYVAGYKTVAKKNYQFIIEMDAGLSHDPKALPQFLKALNSGNECVFGSRFIKGGSISNSNLKRIFLSKAGTYLSNILLGTRLHDATSGYQGFHKKIVKKIIKYPLRSQGHFYQTEIRYLLRKSKFIEIPINYKFASPSISKKSLINSIKVLFYYFYLRIILKAPQII
jgi:dolichol-phosphate mannosyltransferase